MPISVRKIASLARVSPATVSRVLNNYPHVREEIRKRVLDAAVRLGYSPHKNIVWIILQDDYNLGSYVSFMLQAFKDEAVRRGIHLLMSSETDASVLGGLYLCDGVISLPNRIGLERRWAEALPMICINSQSRPGDNILRVSSNNRQGIFLALEYFKSKGHKRIVFINMDVRRPQDSTDTWERQSAYMEWMQKNMPGTVPEIIYYFDSVFQFRQLIDRGVTALLIPGEGATSEIIREARRQHVNIPEEISFIGMEPEESLSLLPPGITTIGQDWPLIAATAFDLLEKLISNQPASDQFIDFKFRERGSVASLSSGKP